ncbi:MAG: phosphate acyltransferase PlsX [Lachnospiraceae bacterium]|nr:phosphate acyltransferase PlsX [Lachnospiraceae bacterium]MBR5738795.1 phosphate acyltransferase PlsX [Lachnospiraceae bacterium]
MIRVAVDAMGGDLAPKSTVQGALLALKQSDEIEVLLVGRPEAIEAELSGAETDPRLQIIPAEEVIETGEHPVMAIQKKKNSSMVVGLKLISEGKADAFVSAGSTGALLVGGQTVAGRLPGIKRSPLAVLIPTLKGKSVLLDCGANVDARPENLVQFAVMGALYAEHVLGIQNPSVGLVNIGTEEEKGNELTRATYPLLKECPGIRFTGNAEARDLAYGVADVYVCEAFTGNVILKMYEGVAKALLKQIKEALMSSVRGKIGGLLIKPSLSGLKKQFDSSEDGGAPMLGLKGLVVKAHGNSTEIQMKNAILQCVEFSRQNMKDKIQEAIQK